jgi:hypothetical protein
MYIRTCIQSSLWLYVLSAADCLTGMTDPMTKCTTGPKNYPNPRPAPRRDSPRKEKVYPNLVCTYIYVLWWRSHQQCRQPSAVHPDRSVGQDALPTTDMCVGRVAWLYTQQHPGVDQ